MTKRALCELRSHWNHRPRWSPERAHARARGQARANPKAMLAQERPVNPIEALVSLGRRPEARARAAAFMASYPSSSHGDRIHRLIDGP